MTNERDFIIVEDENGREMKFSVEALLAMEDQTYALLRSNEEQNDPVVMQVENDANEQYLIGITDPNKKEMVLDAYQIAVDANPAD